MELLSTQTGQFMSGVYALINVVAFFVMWHDKKKAVHGKNAERAPEGFMFFMATLFGSVGVYLGMIIFRHKTRKWYFQIGIPFLIAQNTATLLVFAYWVGIFEL